VKKTKTHFLVVIFTLVKPYKIEEFIYLDEKESRSQERKAFTLYIILKRIAT